MELFNNGKCIIRKGEKGEKLYMINGGKVKIKKMKKGNDKEEEVGEI